MSRPAYRVTLRVEPREDGGLRVWSEDVPELVLSHTDHALVLADARVALEVILSEKLGGRVEVEPLEPLPFAARAAPTGAYEYAARAA